MRYILYKNHIDSLDLNDIRQHDCDDDQNVDKFMLHITPDILPVIDIVHAHRQQNATAAAQHFIIKVSKSGPATRQKKSTNFPRLFSRTLTPNCTNWNRIIRTLSKRPRKTIGYGIRVTYKSILLNNVRHTPIKCFKKKLLKMAFRWLWSNSNPFDFLGIGGCRPCVGRSRINDLFGRRVR